MFIKGDALEILKQMKSNFVDCIITDPPYDHLEKHRAVGTTTRLKKDWFPTLSIEQMRPIFKEAYRVLKPHKHLYVFCNSLALKDMLNMLSEFFRFNNVIVWDKGHLGLGYHYRNQVEFILFFSKGKPEKLRRNPSNLIRIPSKESYRKPYKLYIYLLRCSTQKGDTVLDFFAGSCPLIPASEILGLKPICIDIRDPKDINY